MIRNDQYETTTDREEVVEIARRRGIRETEATENEFHSPDITVDGKTYVFGSKDYGSMDWGDPSVFWEGKSTKIEGLNCPDCQAQAFKTDQKNVAVCGDYPGWYFFYRKLEEEFTDKPKTKFIIKNGDLVEVDETGREIGKDIL